MPLRPISIVGKPPPPSAPKYKKYLDMMDLGEENNYLSINHVEDVYRKKSEYYDLNSRIYEKEFW